MSRGLARRLARIEAARVSSGAPLGGVLRCGQGETRGDALRRAGKAPAGRAWLVLPPRLDQTRRDAWEAAFKAQQIALTIEADIELSALRRAAQEAGANDIGPVAAAIARQRIADQSNPWRINR